MHLWLGLLAGAVLVVVGLTGSLLAFSEELDRWFNADLLTVSPQAAGTRAYRPLDDLFRVLKEAVAPSGLARRLNFPRTADQALCLQYSVSLHSSEDSDWLLTCVDPYTGRLLGVRVQARAERFWPDNWVWLVVGLHTTLLAGSTGLYTVTVIAVLLIISVLTGLILWWPSTGKWRQAFTIKRHASAERRNFDLHKTFGSYSALVLVVLLFTGIYKNLPQYVKPLVEVFSPVTAWPEGLKSTLVPGQTPITPGQALAIAERLFPDGELVMMKLPPDGPEGVYAVGKRAPDEVGSWPYRHVWIEQYSGAVLHVQDPHHGTAGDKFLEWQFPLHTGEAFGLPGRILVCIAGFVPAVLYTTGFIRWRQKARAKRHTRMVVSRNQSTLNPAGAADGVMENGIARIPAEERRSAACVNRRAACR
ncbi:MAG: PepSY-associated TM helix domain-containing protein [Gammaproteobacteria bacterium]